MFNRWLNPLFKIGHKRKLEPDDMYSVFPEDRSQRLGEELQGWAQTSGARGERVRISTWGCVWGRLCLPLGSSETPLLTLHTQPLRLTPGLAHFGGPCSLCICGCGGSPQPRPWRPSSVPGGGVPGGDSLPAWAAHELWVQQSLAGTCFQNLELLPQGLSLWCFRVCTAHLSGALWAGSQHLLRSRRAPCRAGLSTTPPRPLSPLVDTIFFTALCFSSQALGSGSEESPERLTWAFVNESNRKVLLEILFNLGNVYISWGKRFSYCALLFGVCVSVLRWTGPWGERPVV